MVLDGSVHNPWLLVYGKNIRILGMHYIFVSHGDQVAYSKDKMGTETQNPQEHIASDLLLQLSVIG